MIWLGVVIVALAATLGGGILWGGASATPKLALDLQGGTEIVLAAQTEDGSDPSADQMKQAQSIMRQRVDAGGVSEAEITTQGGRNIVISLPGDPTDEQLQRIRSSAKLEFRRVWRSASATSTTPTTAGATEKVPTLDGEDPAVTAARTTASNDIIAQFDAYSCVVPVDGSAAASGDDASQQQYKMADPVPNRTSVDADGTSVSSADLPKIACSANGEKLLLSPVDRQDEKADGALLDGEQLSDAKAGQQAGQNGTVTNNWVVNIEFNDIGTDMFHKVTSDLTSQTEPANRFAVVLDGQVIVAPTSNAIITDGRAQISGQFTQESSQTLADQLKYGALPISFDVQSQNKITPTLGSQQLVYGLIAGAIGLLAVVVYSLFQYRALGLVTIVSLVLASAITYLLVTLMSWSEGYRLSLAGIAGLIVAIGITADSFIVYFERIRDELRDGSTLIPAVEIGWKRALRTILASDTVNFLAAAVLYLLAVGGVQGFAFTLGLTTIVDLVVVMLFTHPMMQLLSTTRFFGEGHHFSGLNPQMLGNAYRGRLNLDFAARAAESAEPGSRKAKKSRRAAGEAERRLTIAERKARAAGFEPHPHDVVDPAESDPTNDTPKSAAQTDSAADEKKGEQR
nr:protein translocase subunit SecD [Pseudoclavibacter sp. 13-3]